MVNRNKADIDTTCKRNGLLRRSFLNIFSLREFYEIQEKLFYFSPERRCY